MMYDLVELPNQYDTSDEINTTIPELRSIVEPDDFYGEYGRRVPIGKAASILKKYKGVEVFGPVTIERVFLTPEQIDFKKKWTTSEQPIFPIWYKVYAHPQSCMCALYRYIRNITNVLDWVDEPIDHSISQTIHKTVFDKLRNNSIPCALNKMQNPFLKVIALGNDSQNIEALTFVADTEKFISNIAQLNQMPPLIPSVVDYPNNNVVIKPNLRINQLAQLNSTSFGIYHCNDYLHDREIPIELDNETNYYEPNSDARWEFHNFINELEQISFTDIYLSIKDYSRTNDIVPFHKNNNCTCTLSLFSRYGGTYIDENIRVNNRNLIYNHTRNKEVLFNRFFSWYTKAYNISFKEAKIYKTWSEEVFIEITTVNDKKISYYVDLVMYSLGTLSLMEWEY